MLKTKCSICGTEETKSMKEQETKGLLCSLEFKMQL